MGGDVGRHLDLAALPAPPERRPQVGQLGLHPVDLVAPAGPVPPLPPRAGLASRSGRRAGRAAASRSAAQRAARRRTPGWSRTGCTGSVLAPWWATTSDLRTSESSSRSALDVVARPGDGAERRQVEAAGEHRRRPQHRALGVVQEVVGPRHRVPRGSTGGPARARARSAAGTGRRAGRAPRPRSSPPSAPRPARCPAGGRRASRRSRPPPPRSARRRCRSPAARRRPAPRTASPRRRSRRRRAPAADRHDRLAGHPQLLPRRRRDPRRVRAGEDLRRWRPRPPASRCSQLSITISSRRPATASAIVSITGCRPGA